MPGIPRDEGRPPGARRVDEELGGDLAGAELALERDDERVEGLLDARDVRGAHDLQAEVLLVARVEVGDDLLRGQLPVGGVEADAELLHAGEVVDAVRVPESQRLPAVLPRASGSRAAVEQDEVVARVEPETPKIEPDRETGLSCADHHDGGVGGAVSHGDKATRPPG